MGNLLDCCERKEKPRHIPELPSFRKIEETDSVQVTLNPAGGAGLFEEFTAAKRSEMISTANQLIKDYDLANFDKAVEAKGGKCYFKELRVKYEQKPNSSENIHCYCSKEIWGFDPLVTLFFELNTDIIDSNTDYYRVVKQECTEDSLFIFYEAKTKKVLMVQPRVTLVIRFVRFVNEDSILDIQQSVEVLGLGGHADVKELVEKAGDQLATVHMAASRLRGLGGVTVKYGAMRLDVHSSVGLALTRPFMASNQKKYAAKIPTEIDDFYRKEKYLDGRKIVWFDSDYARLLKRYQEQAAKNEASLVEVDQREELENGPPRKSNSNHS